MLNFTMLQVQDVKEAASIERRRKYEEERRKRIFNARERCIGIDYAELEKQIQEKHIRDLEEKKLNDIFTEQDRRNANLSLILEAKENQERKKIQKEINEFRLNCQRPEDRREFDLNDPNYIKNTLPMRIDDNDPRLGISSAQKFEGEDLSSDERKKLQTAQTKAFLNQQMKEQKAAEKELKDAEEAYQAAVVARDVRATELDMLEKECRKKLERATANFNKALILQQESLKDIRNRQELEDNFAEMYNAVTGDFLTENPDVAESNFGPGRCIGFKYKGMTAEQRAGIRNDQLLQIEANKQKRVEADRLTKYWDTYSAQMGQTVAKMDQELQVKQKHLTKELAEYNLTLAREQKAYKDYLDHAVYTNTLTPEFYGQFNTTSR